MGINVINIFLFGLSFIILAISAGFATNAAVRLGGKTDPDLVYSHKILTISSIVAWLSVALIIGGIIAYIVFGSETVEVTGNYVVYGLLFFILLLILTVGILSAIAAYNINKTTANNDGAYKASIVSAVLAIIGFVLVLGIILFKAFHKPKKEKEEKQEKEIGWLARSLREDPELAAAL